MELLQLNRRRCLAYDRETRRADDVSDKAIGVGSMPIGQQALQPGVTY
jgi:hypothetical protein